VGLAKVLNPFKSVHKSCRTGKMLHPVFFYNCFRHWTAGVGWETGVDLQPSRALQS